MNFKNYLFLALAFIICSNVSAQKYLKKFQSVSSITSVGKRVYFLASGDNYGNELWTSDGTPDGTLLVKDIYSGSAGSNPQNLFSFNGKVFFSAYTPVHGGELWKSDGTSSGTVMVKEIVPGPTGSNPQPVVVFNNALYFIANPDGYYDHSLYKTDGTSQGTSLFSSYGSSNPSDYKIIDSHLYFTDGNRQLYRTDGTEAGTTMINTDNDYISLIAAVADKLLFMTYTSYYRQVKLYSLSSTGSDPTLVKEFGTPLYSNQEIDNFCVVGEKVFFSLRKDYYEQEASDELWVTDGTSAGTKMVMSFPWSSHWSDSEMSNFVAYKDKLYFKNGEAEDHAFWMSDGTPEGTRMVSDVVMTAPMYEENPPVVSGGNLYFSGDQELWISDGTANGTKLFAEVNQNGYSMPRNLCDAEDALYFVADDGYGLALYNNLAAPEIVLKTSASSSVASGGTLSFNQILLDDCSGKSIDIENIGDKALIVSDISVTGKDFYIQGAIPAVISARQKVTFSLFYNPQTTGTATGILTVRNNDQNESNYVVNLKGSTLEIDKRGFCDSYDEMELVKELKPINGEREIAISSNEVEEHLPAGSAVGQLSVADGSGEYKFSFAKGEGDENNDDFVIEGNKLKTAKSFSYDEKAIYSVRIRAKGASTAEDLVIINVTDNTNVTSGGSCGYISKSLAPGLNDITYNATGDAFVVGEDGTILRSSDDGNSWEEVDSGVENDLFEVIFKDNIGYISGVNVLLKSEDNGNTWSQLYVPVLSGWSSYNIYFIDKDAGYLAGGEEKLLRTINGGRTWEERSKGSDNFQKIWFWDIDNGLGIRGDELLKTTDGGKTWTEINTDYLGYSPRFSGLWFFDKKKGFLLGQKSLFSTDDGGETWSKVNAISANYLNNIWFEDAKTGYISGGWNGPELFVTTDGGSSWERIFALPADAVAGLTVNPSNHQLYVVGSTSGLGSSSAPGQIVMSSGNNGESWTILDEIRSQYFQRIDFIGEAGFVFGEFDGFKTVDNGLTWQKLNLGKKIYDTHFWDEQHGFLVDSDSIYETSDGGITLNGIYGTDPNNWPSLNRLYMINEDVGYALGYDFTIRTENGGKSWSEVADVDDIRDIFFPSDSVGYTVGLFGAVHKTTDGGKTWDLIHDSSGSDNVYKTLYFLNNLEGYRGGNRGLLEKTTDGGKSWTKIFTGVQTDIRKILFNEDNEGYIMAGNYSPEIYRTDDGGVSWQKISAEGKQLSDMDVEGDEAYFCGEYGYMLRIAQALAPTVPGYLAGDSVICRGDVVTFRVADYPSRMYQWDIAGAELHFNRAVATVHFQESGEYELKLNHFNACGTSDTRTLSIVVKELAKPVLTGPDAVGLGEEVPYAVETYDSAMDYNWHVKPASDFIQEDDHILVSWIVSSEDGDVSVIETDPTSGCRAKGSMDVAIFAVTGVTDGLSPEINMYPNPTHSQIMIQTGSKEDLYLKIYDMTGKTYLSSRPLAKDGDEINLQNLPSGIYLLEITDASGVQRAVKKIIKM